MTKVYFKHSKEFANLAEKIVKEQRDRIIKLIPSAEVHHIGSTAVPGSVTKGDVDIQIRVSKEDFRTAVDKLKAIYEINQPENWNQNFASFKKDGLFGMDFGAQLTVTNSVADDFVKLRDILNNDPKLLEEYNQMKLKYDGKNMAVYRKEKATFFQKLRDIDKNE